VAALKTRLRPTEMRPTVSHSPNPVYWSEVWSLRPQDMRGDNQDDREPPLLTAPSRTKRVCACQILTALLALFTCLSITVSANASVRLRATFTPTYLGRAAAVGLDIEVVALGALPPPLAEVSVRYPAGLGIALSGVGIDICSAQRLESAGPKACPADSLMGTGSALTAMQVGPQILREKASVTVVRAPERNGHLAMFFYAAGNRPVIARALFIGELLPAPRPFGGRLRITIPAITTLPGQYTAIERLDLVLAPPWLTYYERIGGKTITYHPRGIPLPTACPHGGFPFSATVVFLNGLNAKTDARVTCPPGRDALREPVHRLRTH
jgi:hypothetical protein